MTIDSTNKNNNNNNISYNNKRNFQIKFLSFSVLIIKGNGIYPENAKCNECLQHPTVDQYELKFVFFHMTA